MNKEISKVTQFSKRLDLIQFLYHHFLMKFSLRKTKKFFQTKKTFDDYQKKIIIFFFLNNEKIIELIKKNLDKKWTFASIAYLDKAILIIFICEYYVHNLSKEIIISEAVKMSQKFSNDNNYKYINKVLDIIFKEIDKSFFVYQN